MPISKDNNNAKSPKKKLIRLALKVRIRRKN